LLEVVNEKDLMAVHRWISTKLFLKLGMNPHIFNQDGTPHDEVAAYYYHPIKLGAAWLTTAQKFMWQDGGFYVNPAGGILPLKSLGSPILATQESSSWPTSPIAGEIVYVTRWPQGEHYYLRSNRNRVFPFVKLDSMDEVREAVELNAPGAKIVEDTAPKIPRPAFDGD
jgi:hypothetical protein